MTLPLSIQATRDLARQTRARADASRAQVDACQDLLFCWWHLNRDSGHGLSGGSSIWLGPAWRRLLWERAPEAMELLTTIEKAFRHQFEKREDFTEPEYDSWQEEYDILKQIVEDWTRADLAKRQDILRRMIELHQTRRGETHPDQ